MFGYDLDTSGLFHCSILDLDRADKHCIQCRLNFVTSKNIRGIVKMASNLSRLCLRGGNLLKNFTVTSGAQRTLSVSAIRSKEYGKLFTTYCVGMKTMYFLNILISSVFEGLDFPVLSLFLIIAGCHFYRIARWIGTCDWTRKVWVSKGIGRKRCK